MANPVTVDTARLVVDGRLEWDLESGERATNIKSTRVTKADNRGRETVIRPHPHDAAWLPEPIKSVAWSPSQMHFAGLVAGSNHAFAIEGTKPF